jgi:hypothetical protein
MKGTKDFDKLSRGARRHPEGWGPCSGTKSAAFVLVAIISIFTRAYADDISLPLEGYFHPGRAMPVKWNVSESVTSGETIQLSASDAVTTQLALSSNPRGIMPWIAVGANVGNLLWRFSSGTTGEMSDLHPLDESDCLVGDFLADDSGIGAIFPNRRVMTIHLDTEDLQSPAMAWETLDAMLLTPEEWQKLSPAARGQLFAEGITLAVGDSRKPDAQLPWRRSGPWWIASLELKLPAMINDDAYRPTQGWTTGRSEAFRRRTVLFGAIYCLLAGGACLWRSRRMPAGFVAISIVAGAAFAIDNVHQSPIFQRSGAVLLNGDMTVEDNWIYQVSHRPAEFRVPVGGFVCPIFSDESQAQSARLILGCDGGGEPVAIEGHLQADEPLALMNRQIVAGTHEYSTMSRPTSPLRLLADESIYPQFHIVGQLAESTDDGVWPTIVFAR